jgi:hypothetical protein
MRISRHLSQLIRFNRHAPGKLKLFCCTDPRAPGAKPRAQGNLKALIEYQQCAKTIVTGCEGSHERRRWNRSRTP